jgi:hypothetical protein
MILETQTSKNHIIIAFNVTSYHFSYTEKGGKICKKDEECGEGTCYKDRCHCKAGFIGPGCLVRTHVYYIDDGCVYFMVILI